MKIRQRRNEQSTLERSRVNWVVVESMPPPPVRLIGGVVFLFSLLTPDLSNAADTVRAEIEKTSAWTGEAVPLFVTLYSPGPFSGTAAFELPDLPQTVFIKSDNPSVSSEEVDGESYFTQRHQFTLYTQRSGEIVIPAFRVRFSGKQTFTSEPEPMEGVTAELRFQSKRPPGTESMGMVISATQMEIQQTWNPEPSAEITTGDVIARKIQRTAEGTAAMMLPVVKADAPDGIEVYVATPEVQDQQERGDSRAERTDTIKYQFQRAGTFDLPELEFIWWDPEQESIKRQSLSGSIVTVSESSPVAIPLSEPNPQQSLLGIAAAIGLVLVAGFAWFIRKPVFRLVQKWRGYHNRPEAIAVRKLRAACKSDDALSAYSALMSLIAVRRTEFGREQFEARTDLPEFSRLRQHWQALSRHLFAKDPGSTNWHGNPLWAEFARLPRQPARQSGRQSPSALPQLNPMEGASGRGDR